MDSSITRLLLCRTKTFLSCWLCWTGLIRTGRSSGTEASGLQPSNHVQSWRVTVCSSGPQQQLLWAH